MSIPAKRMKDPSQLRLTFPGVGSREVAMSPAGIQAKVAGLFAGIAGMELGLELAGHDATILCENDAFASAVLETHFPNTPLHDDVRTLRALPHDTNMIAAGFPCQDLSQAGRTMGICGSRSSLVGEVFRLIEKEKTPWVLLENVPFMLQLGRGRAMELIVRELERLGYHWAYRVVDSRCFDLPQRRRRVYLLASLEGDPRTVLFADESRGTQDARDSNYRSVACGFYWTEGTRGLGWAVDAVPTLKGGSTVGIPSPPAILFPSGEIAKPDIRDAERLQGFPVDWTLSAEGAGRKSFRWRLVGNAVSVPAAKWIGGRLASPGLPKEYEVYPFQEDRSWPTAAWNIGAGRVRVLASEWPVCSDAPPLADFLEYSPSPLSAKATAGFLSRTKRGSLRFPYGFLDLVLAHLGRVDSSQTYSSASASISELESSYAVTA